MIEAETAPEGMADAMNFKEDEHNNLALQKKRRVEKITELQGLIDRGNLFEDLKKHPAYEQMHKELYLKWMAVLEQCGDPKTDIAQIPALQAVQQMLKSVVAYADEKIVMGQKARIELDRIS